jgi:hypothetical protein
MSRRTLGLFQASIVACVVILASAILADRSVADQQPLAFNCDQQGFKPRQLPSGSLTTPGRFQLVQVQYGSSTISPAGITADKNEDLWLLDTATGQSWQYSQMTIVESDRRSRLTGEWTPTEINCSSQDPNSRAR